MKKILVIEDHNEMRDNISELLMLSNYQTITAPNGRVGVEVARKEHPHLILCDVMMPEMDGYGVLRALSNNPDTASIPFIFLTAKSEKMDIRRGMTMGADDYVLKPFSEADLLDAIERRLQKTEAMLKAATRSTNASANCNTIQELLNGLDDNMVSVRSFGRKEFLFKEGNFPSHLYMVKSGKVKAFRTNADGKELITGIYGPGDIVGFTALSEDRNYMKSAQVWEDAEVCLISRQNFQSLMSSDNIALRLFMHMLSQEVMEREENLMKLAYYSVRKRVAETLLLLERYYFTGNDVTAMSIMREDIANIAGITIESAIRTLSDFKKEGLISIDTKGSISLLDKEKLKRMKN